MVAAERDAKRSGAVDVATTGLARAQAGADFRLSGNIASLEQRNNRTGMVQRFTQITFEMVDLERGTIVWSNSYDIARASADDVIYR
jgi:TolB-like protein